MINSKKLPVALDAMGSDNGPRVLVEGAAIAAKEFNISTVLLGPVDEINSIIDSLGVSKLPLQVKNATEVIQMNDPAAKAVRTKKNSSLVLGYQLLKEGEASAILSAGNSGAMMAAGSIISGLAPGIERPAIASIIPVLGSENPNIILDTGANVSCRARNLVQFGVMGSIYYSNLFGVESPRVGLLSNGSESSKGTDTIRTAAQRFRELGDINYVGFVEGNNVSSTEVDVIVCDGFAGNVLLKSSEGVADLIHKQFLLEAKKRFLSKVALSFLTKTCERVCEQKYDSSTYGGSPLLGLKDLAFVLHGTSDSRAVKNAIKTADVFARSGMTQKVSQQIITLDEAFPVDGNTVQNLILNDS